MNPSAGESAGPDLPCTDLPSLLAGAAARLGQAGVPTPAHDARVLLARACGCDLHDLDKALLMGWGVADLVGPAPGILPGRSAGDGRAGGRAGRALVRFERSVDRRSLREPLQYIVGQAPFRLMDLAVGPGVFIPRPETESVVQAGLDWLAGLGVRNPLVVDLCAGSGAVGLSVAFEYPGARVTAVEKSPQAASWARFNALRQEEAIASSGSSYRLVEADALDPLNLADLDGRVDLIISNPPYVPEGQVPEQPEVRDWDPDQALYGGSADGCAIPGLVIRRAATLLRPGGFLVMEHDTSQGEATRREAGLAGLVQVRTGSDLAGRPRFLTAAKPGG